METKPITGFLDSDDDIKIEVTKADQTETEPEETKEQNEKIQYLLSHMDDILDKHNAPPMEIHQEIEPLPDDKLPDLKIIDPELEVIQALNGDQSKERFDRLPSEMKEIIKQAKVDQSKVKYTPFKESKPAKISATREQKITELLSMVKLFGMAEDKYNVTYFNSMSDEEMMQFKIDLEKTYQCKMEMKSNDPMFISQMIIQISKLAEKIAPRYLMGYSSELESAQKDIEKCLIQMDASGDIEKYKKYMSPTHRLFYILGGRAILTASQNMTQGKKEVIQKIEDIASPVITEIKKNFNSSQLELSQHAPSSQVTLCANL